jgi:integrase/recombinase XerD
MGKISWTQGDGPLAPFAKGFETELRRLGHPPSTARHHMHLMGQLNRWLMGKHLGVGDLNPVEAELFFSSLRAAGVLRVPTLASLVPLFAFLRQQCAIAPLAAPTRTPRTELLDRYSHHLVNDRGLTPVTVRRYDTFARRFLANRAVAPGAEIGTEGLSIADINSYLLDTCSRLVIESAKREAADLRSLLRFLYLEGLIETDLGLAMAPVAAWRGTHLVPTLSAADVSAVLAACDRSIVSGRRDYAILILLARLGLRSGEVAALRLADVDWRAGQVLVRGKARRQDVLPLPVEVGEALVEYLRAGRPSSEYPEVILTLYAPPRPIRPSSITNVVYRASQRAGLARVGGHRLRHALASEMLRQGGNLIGIAQALRQSDLATTSGYAKVDREALRKVAQRWPGEGR